ncbi:DMT family transporter [Nitrosomonas sp.]|uniref:DMT family transporter n=1 Tax=Nitrosomonas sp. TaxID=42353 RepID=UPI0025FBBF42|nr:DMT family transporter [Nitrosomonas sp.]MCC6916685.1 DMT family transporter [Nitrosomonas sp.]
MASLWMLVAGLMFACMGVLVKLAAAFFSNTELVFYRSLVGVITTFLVMRAYGMPIATMYWKTHCWRGLSGLGGVLLFFYCILQLPLASAISLNNTWPLFLAFLAVIWLKEEFNWLLAGSLVTGFAGVVLLLRPTLAEGQWYMALIGIGSGLFAGVAHLHVRQLSELGESEWITVFYFTLVCTVATGLWLLFTSFSPVNLQSLTLALGIGITATLAQLAISRAHRGSNIITVGVLSYSSVLFAGLMDLFFWDARLPVSAWAGMGLIILGGLLSFRGVPARRTSIVTLDD